MKKICKLAMSLLVTLALLVTSVGMLGASAAETQLKVLTPGGATNVNFDNKAIGDSAQKSYVAYEQSGATEGNKVMVLAEGGSWGLQYSHVYHSELSKTSARIKLPSNTGTLEALYPPQYSNVWKTHSTVSIRNGGVYTRNSSVDADPYVNFIPAGTLKADKWYRIERFFNYTQKDCVAHRVFVYDENNTLVGCTPEMYLNLLTTGEYWTTRGWGKSFTYTTDSPFLSNNHKYSIRVRPAQENIIPSRPIMLLGTYSAGKSPYDFISNGIKPCRTDKSANDLVIIEEGKVFVRKPVSIGEDGEATAYAPVAVMSSSDAEKQLTIDAEKWYRFETEYTHDDTNAIKDGIVLSVYDKDEILIAKTSRIESIDMRKTGNKIAVGYFRLPLGTSSSFDDIKIQTLNGDNTTWTDVVDENFNSYKEFSDYRTVAPKNTISSAGNTTFPTIRNGEVYFETGISKSINPSDITFKTSYYIDETMLSDCAKLYIVNGDVLTPAPEGMVNVTMGVDGKSAIVALGTLTADTTYKIRISNKLRFGKARDEQGTVIDGTYVGYPLLAATHKDYDFTVPAAAIEKFEVTQTRFLDESGNPLTGVLAKDTTIKAEVTFNDVNMPNKKYMIICAIYNGNKLVNIGIKDGLANVGTSTDVTESINITQDGCTAKIFVWDDSAQINPLLLVPGNFPQ